jgi:hypothetical protein
MKAKRMRRQLRKVFRDQVRVTWGRLCRLPWRERWLLAWMLLWRDDDLDRAARRNRR